MENHPFFTEIIYVSLGLLNYFIDFVIICLELRFCISWFLNINPYFEPFLSLWAFTSPIMWFGKGFYPRIFGLQLAPMINYRALQFVQQNLDRIIESIKQAKIESTYIYDNNNMESLAFSNTLDIFPMLFDLSHFTIT
jgi:uncharacterized protein YggT (Ycf19 family)